MVFSFLPRLSAVSGDGCSSKGLMGKKRKFYLRHGNVEEILMTDDQTYHVNREPKWEGGRG